MDIWMTWCKRGTKCRYCDGVIEVATPMVIGKSRGSGRSQWNRTHRCYFHPQCWVDNGIAYLNANPYTPGIRGRRGLNLAPEDARKRYLLIRRYNTLKQRERLDGHKGTSLRLRMNSIMEEMENVGGIPKSWVVIPVKEQEWPIIQATPDT